MNRFKIYSPYKPTGDQPEAIEQLVAGIKEGQNQQVLLGVTGSGKTFTMANVIERLQRPALVFAHNKTLAAQLYSEFKALFPYNAVEYFVSYYDYYQPEAYIPSSDTFIDKDATINEDIDRMRLSATRALFERSDVIIVASVSCIYGLGGSDTYFEQSIKLKVEQEIDRDDLLRRLVAIQYQRNDVDFHRGTFRVRGDVVDVFPAEWEDQGLRIEFFGDTIDAIRIIDPLRSVTVENLQECAVFPATHYVTSPDNLNGAIDNIMAELRERITWFDNNKKWIESQRIGERTRYDMELLATTGFCHGIENYSRHLDGRQPGEPPSCLLDYYPKDWLMFVDESHVSLSQMGGMYRGDRSRKQTLVDFGFRLPSALDNRPLTFEETRTRLDKIIYVSATPGDWEMEQTGGEVVEQLIRPTGLIDPAIEVRPAGSQVDDLLEEIRQRVERSERVLVTTLTKRMAEELTDYYDELGVRVRYLHSEVDTMERMDILRDLRKGEFDVLIGINLLREGLDLPEVSLVAILDADKEGFLRSSRSLIQTVGRAARNVEGRVIMYADRITDAMKTCLAETERRRTIQVEYNETHGITPQSIVKKISDFRIYGDQDYLVPRDVDPDALADHEHTVEETRELLRRLEKSMFEAAAGLDFEKAAKLRDEIKVKQEVLNALMEGRKPKAESPKGRKRGKGRRR